jgi:hypothetical protein
MPSSPCAESGHLSSLLLPLSTYFLAFGITDEATDDYNQTSRVWLADFRVTSIAQLNKSVYDALLSFSLSFSREEKEDYILLPSLLVDTFLKIPPMW